jgi:hypothetical protein
LAAACDAAVSAALNHGFSKHSVWYAAQSVKQAASGRVGGGRVACQCLPAGGSIIGRTGQPRANTQVQCDAVDAWD